MGTGTWFEPLESRDARSIQSGSWGSVVNVHSEVNRLFDDLFRGSDAAGFLGGRGIWPSTDVEKNEKEYRIAAELPGLEERGSEGNAAPHPFQPPCLCAGSAGLS